MPPDPHKHTRLRMHEHAFIHYYHPATMLFPPTPQLKFLYETLSGIYIKRVARLKFAMYM